MKREIKFRAWDKIFEQMIESPHVAVMNNKLIMNKQNTYNEFPQECNSFVAMNGTYVLSGDFIIMQFTGLLDKNYKEIYEGDIVENYAFKDVVIFEKGIFTTKNQSEDKFGVKQPLAVHNELEIVGNIYDNKELDVQKHTIDKQRLRGAIENLRDYAGGDKITCNMLIKELGLEETK